MKNVIDWLKNNFWYMQHISFLCLVLFLCYFNWIKITNHNSLKDFKDGIQNHLVFDIKGSCFFVRPNDDITVYLIRIPDCDRK
jgi:hypothetical protein